MQSPLLSIVEDWGTAPSGIAKIEKEFVKRMSSFHIKTYIAQILRKTVNRNNKLNFMFSIVYVSAWTLFRYVVAFVAKS